MKKTMRIVGKSFKIIFTILAVVAAGAVTLLHFSIQWMFETWNSLTMEELVFHLNTSLEGANSDMIIEYVWKCAIPAVFVLLIVICIMYLLRKRIFCFLATVIIIGISAYLAKVDIEDAWERLDAAAFVESKGEESTFVEDYYVSPADVSIEFPQEERNLIYIFLESMETTYTDKAHGGYFEDDIIPNLTELSNENENFSGDHSLLNGGYSLTGTTWTIGGMFAETAGIPLDIGLENKNDMDTQESFFAGAITLGDILKQAGYSQTLMIGSEAYFGGRQLYFTEHGDYDIWDYNYSKKVGQIPEDYRVFWGYEDQKLFANAKERLLELANEEKPFNFTMLTVDTHFEDGYVCEQCPDTYGDNQYANVFACSDRQVSEFVEWVKEQDFYDNTTIVLCGDHPTMDKDFCEGISEVYDRRVYTSIINAPVSPRNNMKRIYSTFDMFPTTLAALGVKIEGNRLGLGTNLFSERPTLSEEIGIETENKELSKKSVFLEKLADINNKSEALLKRYEEYPTADLNTGYYDWGQQAYLPTVSNIMNLEDLSKVYIEVCPVDDEKNVYRAELSLSENEEGTYTGPVSLEQFGGQSGEYLMRVILIDGDGEEYQAAEDTFYR